MSVLLRGKEGDEIALIYGEYYKPRDIKKITKGDKLDLLCDDGLNYHVDVKEINHDTNSALLHFCKWSSKYDYKGPLDTLYITKMGKFSEGITLQNNYVFMEKGSGDSPAQSQGQGSSKGEVEKVPRANFEKGKVYSADYFEKPRVNNRRKSDDVVDEILPTTNNDKKRRASPTLYKDEDSYITLPEETLPTAAPLPPPPPPPPGAQSLDTTTDRVPPVADNKRRKTGSSSSVSSSSVKSQPSHALLNNLSVGSDVPAPLRRFEKAEASSSSSSGRNDVSFRIDPFGTVSREQVRDFVSTYTTQDTPSRNAMRSVRSTLDLLTVSIGIEKSILNTKKVTDYLSSNEETLERFLPSTGAKQLISLLQARKNIDIVIAKILSNYKIKFENEQ